MTRTSTTPKAASSMKPKAAMPQPQGVIAHLAFGDTAAALTYYQKAFGAKEVMRMPAEDGKRLLHAEMILNGSRVFLHDDFPEYCAKFGGDVARPPKVTGSTSVTLHLEVANCDEAVKRAVDAGAKVVMPPMDAFWGARYAQIVDPFGHSWSLAHPLPGKMG